MNHHAFDNSFFRRMPGLKDQDHPLSQQTPGVLYTQTSPAKFPSPQLVTKSTELLQELFPELTDQADQDWARILSGQTLLPGMATYSTRYGGHQFGHWAGQLGDGRAISLGELIRNGQRSEIQLKGAGPSVYSRNGDGFAVLRSSLREFIASEAMHYLGVPTTRALALVATGKSILRDILYDGHPRYEPGAITTRVAPSFLRFGHYQILSAHQEFELLKTLADYTIENFFPQFIALSDPEEKYAAWFAEVCERTSQLVIHWQRVGFVHGVMNTDNMSILGLTIDYGPFGWLESFQPDWTPNTTDLPGRRYAFKNQPQVAFWNLQQLGLSLLPLFSSSTPVLKGLEHFQKHFSSNFEMMRWNKLGLIAGDEKILQNLDLLLEALDLDYTLFFHRWPELFQTFFTNRTLFHEKLLECSYQDSFKQENLSALLDWMLQIEKLSPDFALSSRTNPAIVPRNFQLQEVIAQLENSDLQDKELLLALQKAIETPYVETAETQPFLRKRPDWALNFPGCSQLSCSS